MTEQERPRPFYIADNRALDFLNSVSTPSGTQFEWLESGHDFLDWLEQAGMVSSAVARRFRAEFSTEEIDSVAKQARDLREWFRGFIKVYSSIPLGTEVASDLKRVNLLLEKDDVYWQIVTSDTMGGKKEVGQHVLHRQQRRRWSRPEDLLLPIAEAIGVLVCSADFSYVRNCEGPTCTLWFYDISKNHTRRWCTMSVCGNRAKAAAHRARKRAKPIN